MAFPDGRVWFAEGYYHAHYWHTNYWASFTPFSMRSRRLLVGVGLCLLLALSILVAPPHAEGAVTVTGKGMVQ